MRNVLDVLRRVALTRLSSIGWMVTLLLTALSAAWVYMLTLPYCLLCLPSYAGLARCGGDDWWALRISAMVACGILGMLTPGRSIAAQTVRFGALAILSAGWGIIATKFGEAPRPPTGWPVYYIIAAFSFWGMWDYTRSPAR